MVDTHDACVRSRVSEFASSCARTSSLKYDFGWTTGYAKVKLSRSQLVGSILSPMSPQLCLPRSLLRGRRNRWRDCSSAGPGALVVAASKSFWIRSQSATCLVIGPSGRKGAFESPSLIRKRNQTNQLQTKLLTSGPGGRRFKSSLPDQSFQ